VWASPLVDVRTTPIASVLLQCPNGREVPKADNIGFMIEEFKSNLRDAAFCLAKADEYSRKATKATDLRLKSVLAAVAREFAFLAAKSFERIDQKKTH
jgi:hypothetical protein